jgi:hypothetical protein
MKRKIIQLIPAEGWLAVYHDEKTDKFFTLRIAAWALVEDEDGYRYVTGLNASDTVETVDEDGNFLRYIHERGFGELPKDLQA